MSRPIAGQAIANAAWEAYSAVTARYKRGQATDDEMRRARMAYDAAQEGVERAAGRETIAWRRTTRR